MNALLRLAAGLLVCGSLQANLTIYTDATAWRSAVAHAPRTSTVTFNDTLDSYLYLGTGSISEGGILLTATGTGAGDFFVINDYYGSLTVNTDQFLQVEDERVTVSLPSPITFAGFDINNLFSDQYTANLTVDGITAGTSNYGGLVSFLGFTSDSPVSSFEISEPEGGILQIDNLITDATITPEPSQWVPISVGAIALTVLRLRRIV